MGTTVEFSWRPQMRGFVRKGLKAGACDVYMGVPASYDPLLTTAPYYRSTYVIVYRTKGPVHVRSLDDSALRTLKVGVHMIGDDYQNTPPAQALASRGMIDNVRGYPIVDDYSKPESPGAHPRGARARRDRRGDRVGAVRGLLRQARAIAAHHRAGDSVGAMHRGSDSPSTSQWACAAATRRSRIRSTRCSCASVRPFKKFCPTYGVPLASDTTGGPTHGE